MQQNLSFLRDVQPFSVSCVLIVESEPTIAAMLQLLLHDHGIAGMVASSQHNALQVTKALVPLLFLIDTHLSDGDGLDLYDQLHQRKHLFHTPAIILSTNLPAYQRKLEERAVTGLDLPFDLEDLLSLVQSALPSQLV